MISKFRTPAKTYELESDKYVCNRFGIAEFFATCFCKKDFGIGRTVLDVGCGVGPLSLYLADQFKSTVVGIEINRVACKCFRNNIKKFGLSDSVKLVEGDFSKCGCGDENSLFDLIVSNPPLDDNVPDDVVKKFRGCLYDHPDSSEFMYVTNSWHDDEGKDLLDYLFLFARTRLQKGGGIAITGCAIDGATEKSISDRGAVYGFTTSRTIIGTITTESIGVVSSDLSSVNAFYVVLRQDLQNGN